MLQLSTKLPLRKRQEARSSLRTPSDTRQTLASTRRKGQRRQCHPTPVLLPGKSHGRRSLVGCSPGGREESDKTEQLHFHFSLLCSEGNGNPLQCSCLENPRDGVAQSQTQLKWLTSSSRRRKVRRHRKTLCQGPGSQTLPKAEGTSGESRTPPFLPQTQHTHRGPPLQHSRAADSCQWSRNVIQATQNTKEQQYSTGETSGLWCTEGDLSNSRATPSSARDTNYDRVYYNLKWVLKHLTSCRRKLWTHPYSEKMINGNPRCWRQAFSHVWLFATPWTVATRLLRPWDFPGKNIGVGCHFLLQRIFPTQGLNPGLPDCRQTLYHLSHQGRHFSELLSQNMQWLFTMVFSFNKHKY